jgi:16S rRNA G1207 methylase RsmC
MFSLSNIFNYKFNEKKELKMMDILEPTAGVGNLIIYLMKNFDGLFKIDLVEYQQHNRNDLKELVNTAPDILNLTYEPNFLLFVPNKSYDFIIMNPPFHLKRTNHKYLSQDAYDMDFVIRAYNYLKPGGELIAIVSTGNSNKQKFQPFIQSFEPANISQLDIVEKWEGQTKETNIKNIKLTIFRFTKPITNIIEFYN